MTGRTNYLTLKRFSLLSHRFTQHFTIDLSYTNAHSQLQTLMRDMLEYPVKAHQIVFFDLFSCFGSSQKVRLELIIATNW